MESVIMPEDTHRVLNQPESATGWNAYTDDALLVGLTQRYAPWAEEKAHSLGAFAGDPQVQDQARLANKHTPELHTHDRFGDRTDWVEFHPAWA